MLGHTYIAGEGKPKEVLGVGGIGLGGELEELSSLLVVLQLAQSIARGERKLGLLRAHLGGLEPIRTARVTYKPPSSSIKAQKDTHNTTHDNTSLHPVVGTAGHVAALTVRNGKVDMDIRTLGITCQHHERVCRSTILADVAQKEAMKQHKIHGINSAI